LAKKRAHSREEVALAEAAIAAVSRQVKFTTTEYPISVYVEKVTRALQEAGLRKWDKRLKVGGEKADIFLSSHAEWDAILSDPNTDPLGAVRQRLFRKPM
jgi:hypothetical protein